MADSEGIAAGLLALLLAFVPTVTHAQRLDEPGPRFRVDTVDGTVIGRIARTREGLFLEIPSEARVRLPLDLPAFVSSDARTVVQYGDNLSVMHPDRTNLYWISKRGEIASEVHNRYFGKALVDMSADGMLAVSARDYFTAHAEGRVATLAERRTGGIETRVDLYGPSGELIWDHVVPADRIPGLVVAVPGGETVLVVTGSSKSFLEEQQITLYDRRGAVATFGREFGVIQKVVPLGDGKAAFIQGTSGHGLVDLESGRPVWRDRARIRLISDEAAVQSGDRLLLATGDRKDRTQPVLKWVVQIRDIRTGRPQGRIALEEPQPATSGPVFLEVDRNTATLLVGERTVDIRLPR